MKQLIEFAKMRAGELVKLGYMKHNPRGHGENLGIKMGSAVGKTRPCKESVKMWYDEISQYKGVFAPETSHYSQVVWKKTTKVGCAEGPSKNKIFTVCSYMPPGNTNGQFSKNVLKKSG